MNYAWNQGPQTLAPFSSLRHRNTWTDQWLDCLFISSCCCWIFPHGFYFTFLQKISHITIIQASMRAIPAGRLIKRWYLWAQREELRWQRCIGLGWRVGAGRGTQSQRSTSISQSGIHELSGSSGRQNGAFMTNCSTTDKAFIRLCFYITCSKFNFVR